MSVNNSQNNDFEQIYLDQRNYTLTNEEIALRISLLGNFNEPYKDKFGNDLDDINRLLRICELGSYITDEVFLNHNIEYILHHFEEKEFYNRFVEFIESVVDTQLYSNLDLTKIKAIYFFLVTKHAIFLRIYDTPNYPVPKFKIKLENENRIITHNFPFVESTVLKNIDLEYIQNLKKLPSEIAKNILNERIISLINLDYQYGADNSERIKYFRKMMKGIMSTYSYFKTQENNNSSQESEVLKNDNFKSKHPKHNPNLWNDKCYGLFKYLFDNYYKSTKRQITNIWFYLKENGGNNKYALYATKDLYKDFINENYNIVIKNFDKAIAKWEDKECFKIDEHRQNYEDSLKKISEHVKNT